MYETHEDVIQLEASLSNKGVREKKLLEGLKRVKDMMKLKRKKEAASSPDTTPAPVEIETVSLDSGEEPVKIFGQKIPEKPQPEPVEEEDVEMEPSSPSINWDDYLKRAMYFDRKIKKSDVGTRRTKKKKNVEELTYDCIKEKLLDIEARYEKSIQPFEQNWTSAKRKEVLIEKLLSFENAS